MTSVPTTLLWLRRDLRTHDHAALSAALECEGAIQPVFIFDRDILEHFPDPHDRRLTFIANTLVELHAEFKKRGGGLLVLHGKARDIIPLAAHCLDVTHLVAAEDYEPAARKRDAHVIRALQGKAEMRFVKDQLIFAPGEILRAGSEPYKVFTPYANAWRALLTPTSAAPYPLHDKSRYSDYAPAQNKLHKAGVQVLDIEAGAASMLAAIGYTHVADDLWPVTGARPRLKQFIEKKAAHYATGRNMVAEEGTSRLSPYVRFGLISVRECVAAALEARADTWLSELIWREFYAMILWHFPESVDLEWNPKYRGRLAWKQDKHVLAAWQEGHTGYPLVDAAMRQLLAEGWMHNRARMVVASFLTKHLQIDWRLGEAHFAQYLMDYELASNVGGWQWAASVGTDAQPYFRVFNPTLQSEKFDPDGEYIRRYVPELKGVRSENIHAPWNHPLIAPYTKPIVDHATARLKAISMFKDAADIG